MAESKASRGATPLLDVYVKLPSGRTISMDMLPGDKVQQIYDKVAIQESIPEDRILIKYTGKVLNKTHTVGYLGVCAETILKAEIIQVKKYNVYVKLQTGRTLSLEVENVSPVRLIKDLIHSQEDIAPDRQILKFGGRTLSKPNERLLDAGITNEAIISLEIKETSPVKTKKAKTVKSKKARRGSVDSSGSCSGSDTEIGAERTTPESETNQSSLEEHDKEAVMSTFDAAGRSVEIVFSFDTTGSMYCCLDKVRSKLKETVERLIQHIPTIRIGIIAHGDYCDYSNYVLRMVDLTSNVDELVKFVDKVPATGGGDAPECYEWVLHKAASMDWAEDSAKALIVIGDCLPHPPSYTDQQVNWHNDLDILKAMEIKVYGVKALTQTESLPFYQELADRTGGAFITFQNFDIISDMFLAVCYREASDQQFDAFCEEIAQGQDKDMDQEVNSKAKDIQNVLSQLDEQKNKKAEDKPNRYVAAAWWDPELDKGNPGYSYNSNTDAWSPYKSRRLNNNIPITPVDTTRSVTRRSSFHVTPSADAKKTTKTRRSFSFRSRSSRKSHTEGTVMETKPMKKVNDKKSCIIM